MTRPAVPGPAWPRAVADALAAPAGARWYRVALKVNPYDYHGRSAPHTKFPDEQSYNGATVSACRQWHIELIAITDHWRIRTAEGLARAAEASGITVLPGFEAVSSEGIHLLVLLSAAPDMTRWTLPSECAAVPRDAHLASRATSTGDRPLRGRNITGSRCLKPAL
jgi:hypothetical protein